MAQVFPISQYPQAFNAAVRLARQLNRDVGLLKAKEYTRDVYQVFSMPAERFRQGFELRAQVVRPDEPLMPESGE